MAVRTSGNAAYADAVVVGRAHGAGHVRAVLVWIDVVAVIDEVPSVHVVNVAVTVVVNAGLSVKLGLVHPYVVLKVGVVGLERSVDNRHEHVLISGLDVPGRVGVDVGARHGAGQRAVVVVMPLLRQHRVVEELAALGLRGGLRHVNHARGAVAD